MPSHAGGTVPAAAEDVGGGDGGIGRVAVAVVVAGAEDDGCARAGCRDVAPGSVEQATSSPETRTTAASAALFDLTAQP